MTNDETLVAPWRIGIDVGGTFTDLVLVDGQGNTQVVKAPTTPRDPTAGILHALEKVANAVGIGVSPLLADCALFVHGSTVATNTMLEGKHARVGLLTTSGFRDALEIRRGLREDQWNHREAFAPVLVPRYLRQPVRERVGPDGEVLATLEAADVDAAMEVFRAEGVEAVAISLLNSFVNDTHEADIERQLREKHGVEWITRSAALSPRMGEYERVSTATINAGLAPRIVSYLASLDQHLSELGLTKPILLVQSNGGAASISELTPRPVNLLLSGPAAAVGALQRYRSPIDHAQGAALGNIISMEIGGTSCDVMLMANGAVATKDDMMIAGYHVSTPAIDIHTIGAGGGTVAGVDSAGMLFVGPEGAGAHPGPACYGQGGERPTVTDAQLVLGRLRPGPYAGNSISLDRNKAVAAIETHVASKLGVSVEDAAAGIISLLEQNLLHAVEFMSIERGHAPARFTLLAAGGAGPMHGAPVGRGLGCSRVYVPRDAGALCAIGMLHADVRQDFSRYLQGDIDQLPLASLESELDVLRDQALQALAREGFEAGDISLCFSLDLNYPGQLWSIRVSIDESNVNRAALRAGFEAEYQRLYGHIQPDGVIHIASLHTTATGSVGEQPVRQFAPHSGAPDSVEERNVWFPDHGWRQSAIYRGVDLKSGMIVEGPALVEELTTTVVIGPGDTLRVDATGNFVITLDASTPSAQPHRERAPASDAGSGDGSVRDPVILALMQNRLDQISKHMGWVMTRTARSPIFSQSHDFSCFVTDGEGTLIANADGIPIHTGGGGFAVRAIVRDYAGRIEPGDVFVLSDPYVAGGNHLPDWVIARPIFAHAASGPRLAGFCCNRAHQSDIGGGVAGTYNPEATEIWHEGIRLPVCKLVAAGELRDDLWRLLLLNSRTPELLDGDLRAMLGSTRIGEERLSDLVSELGVDPYFDYLSGILDHADRRMREAITALPDGVYIGREITDNDCFESRDIAIEVVLTVSADQLTVDFSRSDPQIKGFKNSSIANTYSSVYMALSAFFDTDIPRNEGTYRCVNIIAPKGLIVNPLPPAPMTMNTVFVAHEIVHAIWQALAQASPERACAGWAKTVHNHVAGYDHNARAWVMYQWHAMGTPGATAERDGFPQLGHLISLGGLDLPNLEFHEQTYPVRYRRWELRTDAAGPGAKRGGTGVHYEADILSPALWSFRAEGLDTPSGYGVLGGQTGAVGEVSIMPQVPDVDGSSFVPPKYGVRHLQPARIVALTPGGGGWGEPKTRALDAVARDVRDGVVSAERAAIDYGVVIDSSGNIDVQATLARRRDM
ncbi:MAG: hydantoinase B/oxoprolinase family protein [Pseudomonadota bacterium]